METSPQHSRDPEVLRPLVQRRDVWAPLAYDTKIHVFKFLRPYDIRKFCVYVNKNWLKFCIDNQNYLPRPRIILRYTVERDNCCDEITAFEQRIIDEYKKREEDVKRSKREVNRRIRYFYLTSSVLILAGWMSAAFLVTRIRGVASSDDVLLLTIFTVFSVMVTRPLTPPGYYCYYSGHLRIYARLPEESRLPRNRRLWLIWLCLRAILGFAALIFTYSFPHLTSSISATWITLVIIYIPEWHAFFKWIIKSDFSCIWPDYSIVYDSLIYDSSRATTRNHTYVPPSQGYQLSGLHHYSDTNFRSGQIQTQLR
ncbi:hypothetical protein Ddc_15383 [Ditylenchus destructor]|nr:hypothetical protein Ddc_15383 [Ditylenchus destructor]